MPIKTGQKYRFVVRRNVRSKQQWWYVVLANNAQVVLHSENYASHSGVTNAAKTFMKYIKPGVAVLQDIKMLDGYPGQLAKQREL